MSSQSSTPTLDILEVVLNLLTPEQCREAAAQLRSIAENAEPRWREILLVSAWSIEQAQGAAAEAKTGSPLKRRDRRRPKVSAARIEEALQQIRAQPQPVFTAADVVRWTGLSSNSVTAMIRILRDQGQIRLLGRMAQGEGAAGPKPYGYELTES